MNPRKKTERLSPVFHVISIAHKSVPYYAMFPLCSKS